MMSKKHYIAIAELLGKGTEPIALMNGLIQIFEEDNPRFDRERFIAAVMKAGEPR